MIPDDTPSGAIEGVERAGETACVDGTICSNGGSIGNLIVLANIVAPDQRPVLTVQSVEIIVVGDDVDRTCGANGRRTSDRS